jgi:hypothetical protein
MSFLSRLFGSQEPSQDETTPCCKTLEVRYTVDEALVQRVNRIEAALSLVMEGRYFTKPRQEGSEDLTAFFAEAQYVNEDGCVTFTGRLTSYEQDGGVVISDSHEMTASDLLGWYMVPIEDERELMIELASVIGLVGSPNTSFMTKDEVMELLRESDVMSQEKAEALFQKDGEGDCALECYRDNGRCCQEEPSVPKKRKGKKSPKRA